MSNNLKERITQFKTIVASAPLIVDEEVIILIDDLWHEIERLRTAKVVSDKVLMPRELSSQNGAKALLSGKFFEMHEYTCPECKGEMDAICEHCDDEGYIREKVLISWTNIKEIYKMAVEGMGERKT